MLGKTVTSLLRPDPITINVLCSGITFPFLLPFRLSLIHPSSNAGQSTMVETLSLLVEFCRYRCLRTKARDATLMDFGGSNGFMPELAMMSE